jgi:hypothetical protein
MRLLKRGSERNAARKAGSSNSTAKESRSRGFWSLLDRKGDQARRSYDKDISSAKYSDNADDDCPRAEHVDATFGTSERPLPSTGTPSIEQSLWDRAYTALGKDKADFLEKYEKLLFRELQLATATSITHFIYNLYIADTYQWQRQIPNQLFRRSRRTM